jgi:hypothetical protein
MTEMLLYTEVIGGNKEVNGEDNREGTRWSLLNLFDSQTTLAMNTLNDPAVESNQSNLERGALEDTYLCQLLLVTEGTFWSIP